MRVKGTTKGILSFAAGIAAGAAMSDLNKVSTERKELLEHLHIDRTGILRAIEALRDPSFDLRPGAARYLAFATTKPFRKQLEDPEVYRALVNALTDAATDSDPHVSFAAQKGLERLRR